MTTPPTPPRPEPVGTADLVAQARVRARNLEGWPVADLFTALAKALEDTAAERDELRIAYAQEAAQREFERGATDVLAAERDRAVQALREVTEDRNALLAELRRLGRR